MTSVHLRSVMVGPPPARAPLVRLTARSAAALHARRRRQLHLVVLPPLAPLKSLIRARFGSATWYLSRQRQVSHQGRRQARGTRGHPMAIRLGLWQPALADSSWDSP